MTIAEMITPHLEDEPNARLRMHHATMLYDAHMMQRFPKAAAAPRDWNDWRVKQEKIHDTAMKLRRRLGWP